MTRRCVLFLTAAIVSTTCVGQDLPLVFPPGDPDDCKGKLQFDAFALGFFFGYPIVDEKAPMTEQKDNELVTVADGVSVAAGNAQGTQDASYASFTIPYQAQSSASAEAIGSCGPDAYLGIGKDIQISSSTVKTSALGRVVIPCSPQPADSVLILYGTIAVNAIGDDAGPIKAGGNAAATAPDGISGGRAVTAGGSFFAATDVTSGVTVVKPLGPGEGAVGFWSMIAACNTEYTYKTEAEGSSGGELFPIDGDGASTTLLGKVTVEGAWYYTGDLPSPTEVMLDLEDEFTQPTSPVSEKIEIGEGI